MGVGKSAVGRNLAKRLHRRFIDLDRLIEKAEGMKVRDIFAQKGESYFREVEKRKLNEVLQQQGQVIATGGGIVLDEENLTTLREQTLLVGLSASTEALLGRVGKNSKRPLLKGGRLRKRVEELIEQRQGRYAQAHVTVDTSDLVIDQVVEKILQTVSGGN